MVGVELEKRICIGVDKLLHTLYHNTRKRNKVEAQYIEPDVIALTFPKEDIK